MDITSDLNAVARRISEITGTPMPVPGLPGNDDAVAPASFASFVKTALDAPAKVPPEQIDRLVSANAATWNVDPNLIKAIIANESGFNANATSNVGAQGLMQLMPETAAGLGVSDAYDPAQNVWGGSKYIKGLLDRFGGDMTRAIAAYNAGPGAVEKYGGVPPYAQTQNYVQNVLASYEKYKSQQR